MSGVAQELGRSLIATVGWRAGGLGLHHSGQFWQHQALLHRLVSTQATAGGPHPAPAGGSNDAASSSAQHSSPATATASSSSSSSSSSALSTGTPTGSAAEGCGPGLRQQAHDGYQVVYKGFFARPHKRLKYASLLNTFASFAAAPLLLSYSSASPLARVAVTASVLTFAVITTGGLHWFTAPYIHQLLYNAQTDTAQVQTLSFLGGSKWHEFPVNAAQAPTGYHPLATFKVNGKTFYIDRANFEDDELLARLAPVDPDSSSSGSGTGVHAHETERSAGD